jgi:hypothetical protein
MDNTLVLTTLKRAVILGVASLFPVFANAETADSRAITDLLKATETHAVLAQHDAEVLESYTRSKLSWKSHSDRLIKIKEHANDLIVDFNKLSSMRAEGSQWQQEAIDRINPLLREMSDHLTVTINHLNDNQSSVHMPPFAAYARTNREVMTATSKLISSYVQYGESKAKAAALENDLTLPQVAHE